MQPEVLELQGTFSSQPSVWRASALLPQTGVSPGAEAGITAGLVGQAREPVLFPGCQERRTSATVATGASRVLEEHDPLPAPYLTRRLLGATCCGSGGCSSLCVSYLTRPLLDASPSFCGAYLHVPRQYLTRRHRHQHPPFSSQGARHPGHGVRNGRGKLNT